jgi:UPF0755 protein
MNSYELVKAMRANVPVQLAFNNQERIENLAGCGFASSWQYFSFDSFKDSIFLKDNGFTEDNVMVMFIPNTYETYWNTSAGKFRDKMIKEYRNFWTVQTDQKRKNKV